MLRDKHAGVDCLGTVAPDAVGVLVDKSFGGVELGPGLAIDNEDIAALDRRRRSRSSRDSSKWILVRQDRGLQPRNKPQLANAGLSSDVSSHEYGTIALPDDKVVRQGARFTGHLDPVVRPGALLDRYGGAPQAGADVRALFGLLELIAAVLDGVDVAAGLADAEYERVGGASVDDKVVSRRRVPKGCKGRRHKGEEEREARREIHGCCHLTSEATRGHQDAVLIILRSTGSRSDSKQRHPQHGRVQIPWPY